jgi:hypothetical protein
MLSYRVGRIAAAGLLAIPPEAAVQVILASANAAALLFLTATMQPDMAMENPAPDILASMCDSAIQVICKPV